MKKYILTLAMLTMAQAGLADPTIHDVAKKGNVTEVNAILSRNPNEVNTTNDQGRTPLHVAANLGYRTMVEYLLVHGANVNALDQNSFTPLHLAARDNKIEVVKLLINAHANVNAKDDFNHTPLDLANEEHHVDMARLLKEHGAIDSPKGKNNSLIKGVAAVGVAGAVVGAIGASLLNKRKVANENTKKVDDFLEQNKKSAGVMVTESGLQYKVLIEGQGAHPTDVSKVKVHYVGTFIDGTEFDSSYKRKEPVVLGVTGMIPGWTEALKLMQPGAKWELVIPSDLAYGKQGRSGIPPNSILKFTVELLEILPAK